MFFEFNMLQIYNIVIYEKNFDPYPLPFASANG